MDAEALRGMILETGTLRAGFVGEGEGRWWSGTELLVVGRGRQAGR
ncbi:MAG: hypothetical protein IRZ31_15480 [Thermogemmatispora sp.]|nr:hypothetical protein [Thermogemmatispora sp.]MBX5458294.1 hypothetical protein [Thermogemmatispora sp.]